MNRRVVSRIFVAVMVVGLGAWGALPSGAQTSSTTQAEPVSCIVAIVPNPAPVGSFPMILVSGFQPNESFTISGAPSLTGTYQADANGGWTITFSEPVPDGVVGMVFNYVFTGEQSGTTCTASLSFVAATETTAPAPPASTRPVTAQPGFTS